jgi:hypothetical protein
MSLAPFIAQAEGLRDKLLDSPLMTAELCSHYSPASLCESVARSGKVGPIGMAQDDVIYQVYAERLAPVVDKNYPKAHKLRPKLTAVFQSLDQFILRTFRPGSSHWSERISGHLEWLMLNRPAVVDGSGYQVLDISRTAKMIFEVKYEVRGPEDVGRNRTEILAILEKAIADIRDAEKLMSDAERIYYRQAVMTQLAKYL